MDEQAIRNFVAEFFKQEENKLFQASLFGSNLSTSSDITTPDLSLTYETMIEALNKVPPMPAKLCDEIRLSKDGFENMKEKFEAEGVQVEERYDDLYLPILGGIQILIRDFIPDDAALMVKYPQNPNDVPQVVGIINLGPRLKKLEFDQP